MSLEAFATLILLGISSILGVTNTPSDTGSLWKTSSPWIKKGEFYAFEAKSSELPRYCKLHPESYLQFPSVIQGAHEVYLDNLLIESFGDRQFKSVRSFYGTLILKCSEISNGTELKWNAFSYSKYFARIQFFPKLVESRPFVNFFGETCSIGAASILVILACFGFLIFWKREPNSLTWSVATSNLFLSFYFIGSISGFMGMTFPMIMTHKIADTGVWIGLLLFFNSLRLIGVITDRIFKYFSINVFIAVGVILFASTGDVVQFGTTLPFGFVIFLSFYCTHKLLKSAVSESFSIKSTFALLSLAVFLFAAVNEILVVTGLTTSYSCFNIGCVGGLLFFILSVNEKISKTYLDLEDLKENLEIKVTDKTTELQQALSQLKNAQIKIIQSSQMAQLGELSATVAHEINSPLQGVALAADSMHDIVKLDTFNGKEIGYLREDLARVDQGLDHIRTIISNIQNSAGNASLPSQLENVAEVVNIAIGVTGYSFKGKANMIVEVDSSLTAFVQKVKIIRCIVNLVTNSVYAMNEFQTPSKTKTENATIKIKSWTDGDYVLLSVADNGPGIPEEVQKKIFQPFVTTKPVGEGTGLGLSMIKNMVEEMNGTIQVKTSDQGTEFTMKFLAKGPTADLQLDSKLPSDRAS